MSAKTMKLTTHSASDEDFKNLTFLPHLSFFVICPILLYKKAYFVN